MVVPPKHPKMIIFCRKTHGCWGNPPILGNPHLGMSTNHLKFVPLTRITVPHPNHPVPPESSKSLREANGTEFTQKSQRLPSLKLFLPCEKSWKTCWKPIQKLFTIVRYNPVFWCFLSNFCQNHGDFNLARQEMQERMKQGKWVSLPKRECEYSKQIRNDGRKDVRPSGSMAL